MKDTSQYVTPIKLLEELGIFDPREILLEAIAEHCGATIIYEPLEGCEARIIGFHERAIITVDNRASRPRQRFSGAHELGHWLRDRGKVAFACTEKAFFTEWSQDNPEQRANRFAADLLLPEFMFCLRAAQREVTFSTVQDLANQFETSLTATAIRLVEHGSFPAMVVCNDMGKRRWFIRGPSLPASLWPRDTPGSGTVAYDLLRGQAWNKGPLDVYADQWFQYPNAKRHGVREDSVRIAPHTVLTLLWWKDERPLIELDELDERE
ncbi:MAG: ImmA/IrrE family metallo-endopeptidase [Acidobacteria bacterium]|nr:ImmA/IrrE family metallo-endopeptidase [Acidobacteriota bacterium]